MRALNRIIFTLFTVFLLRLALTGLPGPVR